MLQAGGMEWRWQGWQGWRGSATGLKCARTWTCKKMFRVRQGKMFIINVDIWEKSTMIKWINISVIYDDKCVTALEGNLLALSPQHSIRHLYTRIRQNVMKPVQSILPNIQNSAWLQDFFSACERSRHWSRESSTHSCGAREDCTRWAFKTWFSWRKEDIKRHPKGAQQKNSEGDRVNIESLDRLQLEGCCIVEVLSYVLNETRLA